jgi:hypothetical protein
MVGGCNVLEQLRSVIHDKQDTTLSISSQNDRSHDQKICMILSLQTLKKILHLDRLHHVSYKNASKHTRDCEPTLIQNLDHKSDKCVRIAWLLPAMPIRIVKAQIKVSILTSEQQLYMELQRQQMMIAAIQASQHINSDY